MRDRRSADTVAGLAAAGLLAATTPASAREAGTRARNTVTLGTSAGRGLTNRSDPRVPGSLQQLPESEDRFDCRVAVVRLQGEQRHRVVVLQLQLGPRRALPQ